MARGREIFQAGRRELDWCRNDERGRGQGAGKLLRILRRTKHASLGRGTRHRTDILSEVLTPSLVSMVGEEKQLNFFVFDEDKFRLNAKKL